MSVKPTRTTVISVATATTLLVAGAAAATIGTSYRHVTIEVDGVSRDVSGFFTTAGDALNTAGVSVGDHDLVAPAADQTVSNGDTVVVRTATPYDVTVDGSQTVAWSTASTVSGILSALPAQTSSMAADRSFVRAEMSLGEGGETVHVVADGTTTDVVASADEGTSAILEKAGVNASPIDRVTLENSGGETTVRTEPTTHIVSKGTKEKKKAEEPKETPASSSDSSSSGSSSSGSSSGGSATVSGDDAAIWAAIAQCESGGNPSTNTGNGYYGMYQFSLPTWQSVGGTGLPSDASAEEQTMRARMLQQRAGWGQWGCAYKLGLV